MDFLYDLINLEIIVAFSFLIIAYHFRLNHLKVLLLLGHILAIFLLNDVLFSPSYFGDQLRQLDATKMIRSDWFNPETAYNVHGSKMGFSSFIYAAFPIPFIHSVQSIAMMNFLIFLIIFYFIKKFKLSFNNVDYFYLLFPSLLLYSSLALRDMLVLFFMFIGIYTVVVRERYLFALLLLSPVIFLKIQNYLMIVVSLLLFFYLRRNSLERYIILGSFVLIIAFIPEKIPVFAQAYELVETWRLALFYDQYMYDWKYIAEMNIDALYQPLGTGFFLIYQIVKSSLYMLLKPLLWEVDNPFQFIQSLENLVIFAMIIWINRKKVFNEKIKQKILFLNCLLLISMTVNGLVVFNFGAAVRYKFTFIVIYFVYFFYLLNIDKLIISQVKSAWSYENGRNPVTV